MTTNPNNARAMLDTLVSALRNGRTIRITASNRAALFISQQYGYVRIVQGGRTSCTSLSDAVSQLSALRRAGYLTASNVAIQ